MAVENHKEHPQHVIRKGDSLYGERSYNIWGTTSWSEVSQYVADNTLLPTTWQGLILEKEDYKSREEDASKWIVTGQYGKGKPRGATIDQTWDLSAQAVQLRESPSTFASGGIKETNYGGAAGDQAPTSHGGMNWDVKRNAWTTAPWFRKGFDFNFTIYKPIAEVTTVYLAGVAGLQLTTNLNAFQGWTAGQLLFMGLTGTIRREETDYALTFSFKRAPNVAAVSNAQWEIPAHNAWDYLHYRHEEIGSAVDAGSQELTTRPVYWYIERFATPTDWAPMGPPLIPA